MTRYEQMTNQIDANTRRLHDLDPESQEARELFDVTTDLILERGELTIGEAQEEVE